MKASSLTPRKTEGLKFHISTAYKDNKKYTVYKVENVTNKNVLYLDENIEPRNVVVNVKYSASGILLCHIHSYYSLIINHVECSSQNRHPPMTEIKKRFSLDKPNYSSLTILHCHLLWFT